MMKNLFFALLLVCSFISCSKAGRDRLLHSTETVNLPPGKKLVTLSWKGNELYYLLREMKPSDTVETYRLSQANDFGSDDNTYIIHEQK